MKNLLASGWADLKLRQIASDLQIGINLS